MSKAFILPADIRDALLQYLASRPWGEADPAMRALLSLKEAMPPMPEEADAD